MVVVDEDLNGLKIILLKVWLDFLRCKIYCEVV